MAGGLDIRGYLNFSLAILGRSEMAQLEQGFALGQEDRKSTRLNSSH